MKSQLAWHNVQNQNVQTLERSFQQPARTGRNWERRLTHLWQSIIARLALSDEPRAWQAQNEQGEMRWNAYDPKTGRSVSNRSADELRAWLEERYY